MNAFDDSAAAGLWQKFKKHPTDELRNALMVHYLPLVRQAAERLQSRLPASVELDDLMSVGVFGLADAIDAYKLDRKIRFTTFSQRRIRGAMIDELRAIDWLPRQARSEVRRCAQASADLHGRLGRQPSDEEVQTHLQVPVDRYRAISMYMRNASHRSIETGNDRDAAGPQPLHIADSRIPDPAHEVQRKTLRELVTRSLSRQERLIVVLYYYEGLRFKDIGATLGVSESRVSQMHSSVVARLKARVQRIAGELHSQAA